MPAIYSTAFSSRDDGPNPRLTVLIYIITTFAFSSVFWYLLATTPAGAENSTTLMVYTVAAMWCPAAAAFVTSFVLHRNFGEFGFGLGDIRWQLVGIVLPIFVGLVMFGSAWIYGIAPFNADRAAAIFSLAAVPTLTFALAFNIFAACGEELGWRGLLVPDLGRFMGFTELALVSGAIWTLWHFPLIFFSSYHGAGSIWYSLLVFIPSVMGAGLILAYLRFKAGSVWVAVLFHGFWNNFIQQFYPALTVATPAGNMMLGEFGWFGAAAYVALAAVFWSFRNRLPLSSGRGHAKRHQYGAAGDL
jgi:membrane protease YdiL (CAAX protease family)